MTPIILQRLFLESVWDIVYFPIWWYSKGLVKAGRKCLALLSSGNEVLAPFLWLKHIFTPMYAQYDWRGRLISFFIRLIQIVFRLALLFVWFVFCSLLFMFWLSLPIIVFYGLVVSPLRRV